MHSYNTLTIRNENDLNRLTTIWKPRWWKDGMSEALMVLNRRFQWKPNLYSTKICDGVNHYNLDKVKIITSYKQLLKEKALILEHLDEKYIKKGYNNDRGSKPDYTKL